MGDDYIISGFLKAAALGKKAQEKMDEESCKVLSLYVCFLRGMALVHQNNHWAALSFGDHLLFQRLYEETQEIVDEAAERVVGLCGELMYEGKESFIAAKFAAESKDSIKSLLESSLAVERYFSELVKKTYEHLKDNEELTLGLDDLLMSQASVGESHVYLLKQAIKGGA